VNAGCKLFAVLLWALSLRWIAVAIFIGPDIFLLYSLFVPSAQGLGRVLTTFRTGYKEVWLTIDDGPDPTDTPRILDLLDRYGAKATFFVIGRRAALHPGLVSEIVRRGSEVAHHTQTHPICTFWFASPARVKRELDDCLGELARSGVRPRWFRAPAGIKSLFLRKALGARNLATVAWSRRGWDCATRDPERVRLRIMRNVRPGAIILLHEGEGVHSNVRVHAIAGVLAELKARGFACVLPTPVQLR
jgi:peptidoglycan/xylan/chitin deacetylase (PgdA/CDA1 family)